jgi:Flp pilus assembly protein TadD
MKLRKEVLEKKHRDTMTSMNNLALTFSSQRRLEEAEKLEVQAVELTKEVLGNEALQHTNSYQESRKNRFKSRSR